MSPPKCAKLRAEVSHVARTIPHFGGDFAHFGGVAGRASPRALRDAGTKESNCALMFTSPTTQKEIGR